MDLLERRRVLINEHINDEHADVERLGCPVCLDLPRQRQAGLLPPEPEDEEPPNRPRLTIR